MTEIILVDDASSSDELSSRVSEQYIKSFIPIVKLIRLKKRFGIMRSRMFGALIAKSEVLVFLDSHCEAYHNWLPPLLGL